jgi:hypothetical protein
LSSERPRSEDKLDIIRFRKVAPEGIISDG